jgi:hypothetical protein
MVCEAEPKTTTMNVEFACPEVTKIELLAT